MTSTIASTSRIPLAAAGKPPAGAALVGPARGTRDALTTAREFAGLFYSMMLSEMQKSVPENPYSGGPGEETFRSMWTSEMGRNLAYCKGDALVRTILAGMRKAAPAVSSQVSAGEDG